jgi:hypothetical protein
MCRIFNDSRCESVALFVFCEIKDIVVCVIVIVLLFLRRTVINKRVSCCTRANLVRMTNSFRFVEAALHWLLLSRVHLSQIIPYKLSISHLLISILLQLLQVDPSIYILISSSSHYVVLIS